MSFSNYATFGLKVHGGAFEALFDGSKRASMKYPAKTFSSGRIGILWNGNRIAGIIPTLEVTGTIDAEKTLKDLDDGQHAAKPKRQ